MTVTVTEHAKLRYMQRAGVTVGNVTGEIRDRLEAGTPTERHVTDGLGWQDGSLILVTDENQEVVKTVLLAGEGR